MAISYHVYANDGQGGAIDYSKPIATVPVALATPLGSFALGPLIAPSNNLFAIRAFDEMSGVEEANTDARVCVLIDADGRDVSSQPNAVLGLSVRWTIGEVCLVSWCYASAGQGGPPSRFLVTASFADMTLIPGSFDLPTQEVASVSGVTGYGCRLAGLTTGSDWTVQVQAIGALAAVVGPPASVRLRKQSGSLASIDRPVAIATA